MDQVPNFPKGTEVRRYQQGTLLVIDDKRKVSRQTEKPKGAQEFSVREAQPKG